jgi:lipopolysaccharide heptosyltransferase I
VRILIVRLSALGDIATGLAVLATVRARRPDARVGWLVEDRFADLLQDHPQIDTVHVYERKGGGILRNAGRLLHLTKSLRAERYDAALDLQGNLKSGFLTRLSGAARRVGLGGGHSREGNGLFVKERVAPPPGHRLGGYLAVVEAVLGPGPVADALLPASPQDHRSIVLHPGTSRFGAFKRWPPASYAALGDRLAERLRAKVLLTAGPGERAEAEAVARALRAPAEIAEPAGLQALVDVLAGARLVVAGDTGPAHLAAALGVPTVSLFGPKDPAVLAPVGPRTAAVRAGVRCSPCALRHCPDPVCMTQLTVDAVEARALALLDDAETRG